MKGLVSHLLTTLRLNFRSKMPVIYGYLVPVFFLVGFAAVFRGASQPVIGQLGQLLTITVLGGTCFGMPTAMVSERERGIWRRYRLLPAATAALVISTMVARLVLVVSSALLQIVLAIVIYKMPLPAHPAQMAVAFGVVAFAFIGMGLVIAMLADTVPAVQALGQAIFLPMILIGGVGLPLSTLPGWAQVVAGFMPGRYAVEAINACANADSGGLSAVLFSLVALIVIGAAACVAGSNMFRWDAGQKLESRAKIWVGVALAAWGMVGVVAAAEGRLTPHNHPGLATTDFQTITDSQINSITYDDLADDNGVITPLISSPDDVSPSIRQWMVGFAAKLDEWIPAKEADLLQRTRNLLSLAAVADLAEYQYEGEVPYVVFERLKSQIPPEDLKKILADIILHPGEGSVRTSAVELGIGGEETEQEVRDRAGQYAKKLLGRLLGKLG